MVSFRAPLGCPICHSPDNGKWTCPPCTDLVSVHRDLVRNLQEWRGLFEQGDVPDTLIASDARSYCLFDVQAFYGYRVDLPDRMRQAIELCLYENRKEKDAAVAMGIAETNPVSIYATVGLTTILGRAAMGELDGYRIDIPHMEMA